MSLNKLDKMTSSERLLVELNVQVGYLSEGLKAFQKEMAEQIANLRQSTIGRQEFQLALEQSNKTHDDHETRIEQNETDIEDLKTTAATLSGQIRVWGWIITTSIAAVAVAVAVLTIYHH